MILFRHIKNTIKYWLTIIAFSLFFLWWFSNAEDDLLWQLIEPTYYGDTTLNVAKNSDYVWTRFFWGSKEIVYKVEKVIKKNDKGQLLCKGGSVCSTECNGRDGTEEYCDYQYEWLHKTSKDKPSIIVKATRILLSLVVALSVTMILYNGMMYIVETWQWKEWKDLVKNIAFIVIWILVALFSVVIITLIQSIPDTLENELVSDSNSKMDNEVVNDS